MEGTAPAAGAAVGALATAFRASPFRLIIGKLGAIRANRRGRRLAASEAGAVPEDNCIVPA